LPYHELSLQPISNIMKQNNDQEKIAAATEAFKEDIKQALDSVEHLDAIIKENQIRKFTNACLIEAGNDQQSRNVRALENTKDFEYLISRMTEENEIKDKVINLTNEFRDRIVAIANNKA
jgi:hypothetical protein